jgi:hypothetical protein
MLIKYLLFSALILLLSSPGCKPTEVIEKITVVYTLPVLESDSLTSVSDSSTWYLSRNINVFACPKVSQFIINDSLISETRGFYYFGFKRGEKTGYFTDWDDAVPKRHIANVDSFLRVRPSIPLLLPTLKKASLLERTSLGEDRLRLTYLYDSTGIDTITVHYSGKLSWKNTRVETLIDSLSGAKSYSMDFGLSQAGMGSTAQAGAQKISIKYLQSSINASDSTALRFLRSFR